MSETSYAISGGCYSDYQVYRVFERRADAEAWLEAFRKAQRKHGLVYMEPLDPAALYPSPEEGDGVEEFPFEMSGSRFPEVYEWWSANTIRGEVSSQRHAVAGHAPPKRPRVVRKGAPNHWSGIFWSAVGDSKDAVVKAVADRMMMDKAMPDVRS